MTCGCETPNLVPNPIPPSWAVDIVARSYRIIQESVPAQWLPKLDQMESIGHGRARVRVPEYGCGEYGCVLPTLDPDVVLKVTSDDTEAQFAAHLSPTLVAPICVTYHSVLALDTKYKGNGVYLVWRESADMVGKLADVAADGDAAAELIAAQHAAGMVAFDAVRSGNEDDMHVALEGWAATLSDMMTDPRVPELHALGRGMLHVYQHQHILFGDIHEGNIGLAHRPGEDVWVITDPGHVAVIAQ